MIRKSVKLAFGLLGLGAAAAVAAGLALTRDEVHGTADEWIAGYAQRFVEAGGPGLAIAVTRDGSPIYVRGFGLANIETQAPIDANTKFHIGSIGKQFTALCILMLVQDGRVELDAPVAQYLPELASRHGRVTVRQSLQHLSGLPSYYPGEEPETGAAALDAVLAANGRDRAINSDAPATLAKLDGIAPPGTKWEYSNSAYEMLGALIERVSGKSYAEFMKTHVFEPLQMTAFVAPDAARTRASDVAMGYETDEEAASPGAFHAVDPETHAIRRKYDGLSGSGAIYASLNDLIAYDRAWDRGMPLVKSELIAEMLKPAQLSGSTAPVDTKAGYGYGMGLELVDERIPSSKKMPASRAILQEAGPAVYHPGGWPGFSGIYARFPEKHIGVIALRNRDPRAADAAAAWGRPLWMLGLDRGRMYGYGHILILKLARPFLRGAKAP